MSYRNDDGLYPRVVRRQFIESHDSRGLLVLRHVLREHFPVPQDVVGENKSSASRQC